MGAVTDPEQVAPITWESKVSYGESTSEQKTKIHQLLKSREITRGGNKLEVTIENCIPPIGKNCIRDADQVHVDKLIVKNLMPARGVSHHNMIALLVDDDLELSNGKLTDLQRTQLRHDLQHMTNTRRQLQMLAGNHTTIAKQQMKKMPGCQEWEALNTIFVRVFVNLPESFALYLAWENNFESIDYQLKPNDPIERLMNLRKSWETVCTRLISIPEAVVKKGFQGIKIWQDKQTLQDPEYQWEWTNDQNLKWKENAIMVAYNLSVKKSSLSGSDKGMLSWAQRSNAVWDSFRHLVNEINK